MTCYEFKCSHWWKIYFKRLQDLLSSVNAVILTNERFEFITGHMTYNPAYTLILQMTVVKFFTSCNFQKLLFSISVSVSFCMFPCSKGHSVRAYIDTI